MFLNCYLSNKYAHVFYLRKDMKNYPFARVYLVFCLLFMLKTERCCNVRLAKQTYLTLLWWRYPCHLVARNGCFRGAKTS